MKKIAIKFVVILVILTVSACSSSLRPYTPTVSKSPTFRAEIRELPPDPSEEKTPDSIPKGDWIEPMTKGECLDELGTPEEGAPRPCPANSGILVSEQRAYKDGLYRLRYKELRHSYEADRTVWAAHRELYEKRLELANQSIQTLQPTWWDKNKLQVGTVSGVVLGMITTIAVLAAANSAQ